MNLPRSVPGSLAIVLLMATRAHLQFASKTENTHIDIIRDRDLRSNPNDRELEDLLNLEQKLNFPMS